MASMRSVSLRKASCPLDERSRRSLPSVPRPSTSATASVRGTSQSPSTATTVVGRSEEHTSELQSLMRISYAVFCLKKKNYLLQHQTLTNHTNVKYMT